MIKSMLTCTFTTCALVAMAGASCEEPPVEICNNGLDDDENGAADCDDDACLNDTACAVVGQCEVDVNFPRIDPDSAAPLAFDTAVTGTLCPAYDDDGYLLAVANPGTVIQVTLSMETFITSVEPAYSVLRMSETPCSVEADDVVVATECGGPAFCLAGTCVYSAVSKTRDPDKSGDDPVQGVPVEFTAASYLETAGNYLLVVEDGLNLDPEAFDNVNLYTLLVTAVAEPDGNEPNNTPETATVVTSGATAEGIIATARDVDWYAVDAGGDGEIVDVQLTAPADSGIEYQVALYAADRITELQATTLSEGATAGTLEARVRKSTTVNFDAQTIADLQALGLPLDRFYLSVKDGGDDGDTDATLDAALGSYTVAVTVFADPDTNEAGVANEVPANAVVVASGATLDASVATFADNDLYRVNPNATVADPDVLVVELQFDGAFDDTFQPQVRIITTNPEENTRPCNNGSCGAEEVCLPDNTCGEVRHQRFIATSPFRLAYPLRNNRAHYISVNEFGDDGFQETGGYTINVTVTDDTDPGEAGDDFLVPNLEEAGYQNDWDLRRQIQESKPRARGADTGFVPVCADATPTGVGCLDLEPVENPVGYGYDPLRVACSDAEAAAQTVSLSGRLTYEGDRDFFHLQNFPGKGYFGVQVDYSVSGATPNEMAIFVHGDGTLIASTLRATEGAYCGELACTADGCGPEVCQDAEVCVDERCWSDGPSNPGGSFQFGPSGPNNECIVEGPENGAPIHIEVVDNGLNDFDLNTSYTLTVTITCGCPGTCDTGQDYCQNGL
ncbi:MAG: hypothetical protein A2138_26670 [Deltaproteobacteria bacterium RBG_16_71_12]|nr:MAG: hypothetical protein A2138_26670 [Deltaproteobacteria bacterium RBG_16_71_12]